MDIDIQIPVPPDLTTAEQEWLTTRLKVAIGQVLDELVSSRMEQLIHGDDPIEAFVGLVEAFGIGQR